jgi:hypothetical protein
VLRPQARLGGTARGELDAECAADPKRTARSSVPSIPVLNAHSRVGSRVPWCWPLGWAASARPCSRGSWRRGQRGRTGTGGRWLRIWRSSWTPATITCARSGGRGRSRRRVPTLVGRAGSLHFPSARRQAARDGAQRTGTPGDGWGCRRAVCAGHGRTGGAGSGWAGSHWEIGLHTVRSSANAYPGSNPGPATTAPTSTDMVTIRTQPRNLPGRHSLIFLSRLRGVDVRVPEPRSCVLSCGSVQEAIGPR